MPEHTYTCRKHTCYTIYIVDINNMLEHTYTRCKYTCYTIYIASINTMLEHTHTRCKHTRYKYTQYIVPAYTCRLLI